MPDDPTRRLRVLHALRTLTDAGHPDITPAVVSTTCGEAHDYAWQEMARCRAEGLAWRTGEALGRWAITETGRRWLDGAARVAAEMEGGGHG